MRKDEITYHGDWSRSHPAVNVKVHGYWDWHDHALAAARSEGAGEDEAHAFAAWCEGMSDEDADGLFWLACEIAFDDWQEYVREILGYRAKCYTAGRSGGWAYVDDITADEVEGWDAIALGRWARIARSARSCADDVPRSMAAIAFLNGWERECELRAMVGDHVLAQFAGVPA